jgi:hypothetical protein
MLEWGLDIPAGGRGSGVPMPELALGIHATDGKGLARARYTEDE